MFGNNTFSNTLHKDLDYWGARVNPVGGKAVVLFSGGQDSTTCLGIAIKRHGRDNVIPVSISYGQRHAVELEAARNICATLAVEMPTVIDLEKAFEHITSSALLDKSKSVSEEHEYLGGLPASFVPVRNAMFLTAAFGVAMERSATVLYTGVCQTDYSGYPDCRADFIERLNTALNIGYHAGIKIATPLMNLDKAATFELADRVGILSEVITLSRTCYNGDATTKQDYGVGCGTCPACRLRAAGWTKYIQDYTNLNI